MSVDFLHTFCAIESFGNHFHFDLRRLDRVAPSDHGSKDAVAREIGIAGHKEVAEIYRVVNVSLNGVDRIEEAAHLLHGVAHKHTLEVVAVFQAVADSGSDGINVFQDRSIFDANHVGVCLRLDVAACNQVGEIGGFLFIGTPNREIS